MKESGSTVFICLKCGKTYPVDYCGIYCEDCDVILHPCDNHAVKILQQRIDERRMNE